MMETGQVHGAFVGRCSWTQEKTRKYLSQLLSPGQPIIPFLILYCTPATQLQDGSWEQSNRVVASSSSARTLFSHSAALLSSAAYEETPTSLRVESEMQARTTYGFPSPDQHVQQLHSPAGYLRLPTRYNITFPAFGAQPATLVVSNSGNPYIQVMIRVVRQICGQLAKRRQRIAISVTTKAEDALVA